MKALGGKTEGGIVVGNAYDKYNSSNPIVRLIMNGFKKSVDELVNMVSPCSIHEIGCGEGYWTLRWISKGIKASGCDFSSLAIQAAQAEAKAQNISPDLFTVQNIYDLTSDTTADLLVCCEVLEHLEYPEKALEVLRSCTTKYLLISVPREPLWSLMNLVRFKYLNRMGNTPGHIQQWSRQGFVSLISNYFDILEVRSPIPWSMLLCKPKDHE